ncbi:hypothetical protein R3P38DRAFT_893110 [Favolaschia claudopus]|uniref:GATA-type domain-containing protein n=1 Tax=Favolaschia claudopus TaxID=2862362 RepID=A0AAW0BUZ1_9AGAR
MSSIDRKQSRAPGAGRYGNGSKAATQGGTAAPHGGNTQSEDRIQPQPVRSYSLGSSVDTSFALMPSAPQPPPNLARHADIPYAGRSGVLASSLTATVDSFPADGYTAISSSITSQQPAATSSVHPPSAPDGAHNSSGLPLPLLHRHGSPPSSNDYQLACQAVMNLLIMSGLNSTTFVEHFSRYHVHPELRSLPQFHAAPPSSCLQPPSPYPPSLGAHPVDIHPPSFVDPALLTGPSTWSNVTPPLTYCGIKHDAEVESIPTEVVNMHASVSTPGASNSAGPSKLARRARSASQNGGVTKAMSRRCFKCMKKETPQWRLHPTTGVILCNYCGQKAYKTDGKGKGKQKMSD